MTTDFYPQLVDLLIPNVMTVSERTAFISDALGSIAEATSVTTDIVYDGSPKTFTLNAVRKISEENCQLFKPLLETLKGYYGASESAKIEDLLGMVDDVCAQSVQPPQVPEPVEMNKTVLRRKLGKSLSGEEFEIFVSALNDVIDRFTLDYDDLKGGAKTMKILSMLDWLENRRLLPTLIDFIQNTDEYAYILEA